SVMVYCPSGMPPKETVAPGATARHSEWRALEIHTWKVVPGMGVWPAQFTVLVMSRRPPPTRVLVTVRVAMSLELTVTFWLGETVYCAHPEPGFDSVTT